MLKISELYIYPVKSLPGIALQQAKVTPTGFEYDRRWMLVDKNNRFITQWEFPVMTQLLVTIENEQLTITHKTTESSLSISLVPVAGRDGAEVVIWDDTCVAEYVSEEADQWFSAVLGADCRLVYMPDNCKRVADQRYAPEGAVTSFSDAYPYMMLGQASLNDLNRRLVNPLSTNRFRPNIIFTGGQPYQEDRMNFAIGEISFYGVKLCARCVITTIDQDDMMKGKEPLKTLASYRSKNNKIYFGQNLIHKGEGMVSVGDEMRIISLNTDERFVIEQEQHKDDVAEVGQVQQ